MAKAGIAAGADLINDIWGLKWDERLAGLIAESKVACCLMHNRETADYQAYLPDFMGDNFSAHRAHEILLHHAFFQ